MLAPEKVASDQLNVPSVVLLMCCACAAPAAAKAAQAIPMPRNSLFISAPSENAMRPPRRLTACERRDAFQRSPHLAFARRSAGHDVQYQVPARAFPYATQVASLRTD